MDLGLKGKRALVTGGTRGIGRAIAETLAAEGADVAICARNADQVAATVEALQGYGGKAMGEAVDVVEREKLAEFADQAVGALGGLDIVIANVSALAGEDWRAGLEVDVLGTVNTVDATWPHLERSEAGAIVVISSISAVVGSPVRAYNSVKAAIITYAANLAQQGAPKNILANSVSPGTIYFEGGVWHQRELNEPEAYKWALARNPMGRMGGPQEVANGAVFLASPAASFITGTNLIVDGAMSQRVQF